MYLFCYGTRPEIIKMFPLIRKFSEKNITFKTLFSGQHEDLFKQFSEIIPNPDYTLNNIMKHGQDLNQLSSKIMNNFNEIINKEESIKNL